MLTEAIEKRLIDIIGGVNPDIFIVEIELHRSTRSILNVVIDTDEGVKLDECKSISKKISYYLEEEEVFDFAYTIEVSSPGLDRPLKLIRQYKKNIGRELKVVLNDGSVETGKLLSVEDGQIVVMPVANKKKNKKDLQDKDNTEKSLGFEEIKEAKVLVSFK